MNHYANEKRRSSLSSAKLELLQKRLRGEFIQQQEEGHIDIKDFISQRDKYPLSLQQKRLWFLDELFPGNSAYNEVVGMRIRGSLNLEALQYSIDEIVKRHESLRTSFTSKGGEVYQVIKESIQIKIDFIDLSHAPINNRELRLKTISSERVNIPFNFNKGNLLRPVVIKLDKDEHVFLIITHHIISDGWSIGVLFKELSYFYKQYSSEKKEILPYLSIQYKEFACWQQQSIQSSALDKQINYWKEKLYQLQPLQLYTDYPRPDVMTFKGNSVYFEIPKQLLDKLRRLGSQYEYTLYMLLLTAFKALLYRYTNSNDISIGTPVANRGKIELDQLIGFFVNTLIIRTNLSGDPTFKELLERVKRVVIGAMQNQDIPIEKIVDEIHSERDLSRTPLFQVMFALQNAPMDQTVLSGMDVTNYNVNRMSSKFDIWLSLFEHSDGVRGVFEYSTD
ncbi:condensation domain-containing protein, partial [Bacillus wiedmannii]|uniref:condensation domain-containing protein n=1 Tax=Bacillus wiedmannii TaxID=1890302 RepID=UPI000BFAF96B